MARAEPSAWTADGTRLFVVSEFLGNRL